MHLKGKYGKKSIMRTEKYFMEILENTTFSTFLSFLGIFFYSASTLTEKFKFFKYNTGSGQSVRLFFY